MSEAGGMTPHHLFLEELARRRAEVDQDYVGDRNRLICHIRSLPPAERRIYLCSDEEVLLLPAADRRELMVESNVESEAAVSALLRRQSWKDAAVWASLLAVAGVLAMMSGGLVQISAAIDQALAEGRVPLAAEQQIALQRINEIGTAKFVDVPLAELRQRVEMPRQMIDVWQSLEVNDATSSADKEEREKLRIKVVGTFLYSINTKDPLVQKRGVDLLTDLFADPERRGEVLENLCRQKSSSRR
ncbi:hypothetical protein [Azospirillum lipoferum]|uniref:Uncharacterized protein n=1 Tax=Azospirillum lipoferum (strain 4B) TaxID=862719 RepID=G7ZA23_AZOL4|nr:hypothetical protein [Azospirillum lipoferum]CBS88450.1 protein of unknown function [Azospirillum lipoferum 4B]